MKCLLLFYLLLVLSCSRKTKSKEAPTTAENQVNLMALLDTIWNTEQRPIRLRDSLMEIYGAESELVKTQQAIYKSNHKINERFWELIDEYWQDHGFEYVGCCAGCGSFELR